MIADRERDALADGARFAPPLLLGPDIFLTCAWLEAASSSEGLAVCLTQTAVEAMHRSCAVREELEDRGEAIYGTTTGFGPLVAYSSANEGRGGSDHGQGLLSHLGAGWGPSACPWVEPGIVRAAMLVRAQSLAQGFSAVRPALVIAYLRLIEAGITPCVPPSGSVGASGDLIPLAHIASALVGSEEALVRFRGEICPASEALKLAGLNPVALTGRDALALTNGTSFLTACAALAVARAERLVAIAESLTGWMYRLLGARLSALDEELHRARGHLGQVISARNIRQEALRYGPREDAARALQEIYSIRCAPQILGACRENMGHARRLVETEINGVSDNPLFFGDGITAAVAHGGNFQGQQVAFAADALNAALTQVAVLADRQIDAVVSPSRTNREAPLLLAYEPGETSGLAGAQLTATALVAEMRSRAQMHATFSIPTNAGNQDVVSMGAMAAQAAYEQTERLAAVLAILGIALTQLDFLRAQGRATGASSPVPPWMPEVTPLIRDRALHSDVDRVAKRFLRAAMP